MSIQLKALDNFRNQRSISIDRIPDKCPICHSSIRPVSIDTGYFAEIAQQGRRVECIYQCPNDDCQRIFIGIYLQSPSARYDLVFSVPAEPNDAEFEQQIKAISPEFCLIYNQAHKAEQHGLKLVCGPGYRKALEFLIKDYVSSFHSGELEKIKRMQLGACISAYVTSDKVKAVASRAAWLGNDETHYTRKWEDKDLDDLKRLISLTTAWIHMEILTAEVIKDMPEGK